MGVNFTLCDNRRLRGQGVESYDLQGWIRDRVVSVVNLIDSRISWEKGLGVPLGVICVMLTELLTVGTTFLGWHPRLCNWRKETEQHSHIHCCLLRL